MAQRLLRAKTARGCFKTAHPLGTWEDTHAHTRTHSFFLFYTITKNISACQQSKMMKLACKTWTSVAIVFKTNLTWNPQILLFRLHRMLVLSATTDKLAQESGAHARGGGWWRWCNFGRFWRRSCLLVLFEDEAGHLRVNQMSHFTVNINLACAECGPPQLLQGTSEEMSHISLSSDRLEIKVLIIHFGLLPGNRPPLAEHVCWLREAEHMVKEEWNLKLKDISMST